MTRHPAPASPVRHDDVAPHDMTRHHVASHGPRRLLSAGARLAGAYPDTLAILADRDADQGAGAWRVTGPRAWCSGAATCDLAALDRLVVAGADA